MTTTEQLISLQELSVDWSKLYNSSVLIAGASGLIGSALAKTLIANEKINCDVYVLGRSIDRLKNVFSSFIDNKHLHLLQGDVTKLLVSDMDFDYIVDCASNANPAMFSSNPVETILGNIRGVDNLINYGRSHKMKRFLYISSGEVYGEGDGREFKEADSGYVNPLNPRGCYPISKRAAENLCAAYSVQYGVDVVIARPCHTYGPGFLPTDDRAYAQFLRKAAKREHIVLKSSGMLKRSWCYIVDCVSALIYILLYGESGNAYNISDQPLTIKDFAKAIADAGDVDIIFEIKADDKSPIITNGVLDSQQLKGLGWSPYGSLEQKIKSTLAELKLNY